MTENSKIDIPWHNGEVWLQKHVGVADRMAEIGRKVIRPYMPQQHRDFFSKMPFMVIGGVDSKEDVWVSAIVGKPNFITSPTDQRLDFSITMDPNDPINEGLTNGASVGLLGIELNTRRRNRMNGSITNLGLEGFSVNVDESFGNCPQYIQLREYEFHRDPDIFSTHPVTECLTVTDEVRDTISNADTFFVASYVDIDDNRKVDVSHRGGKKGFVKIDSDGTLTIPDYAGNLFFNTLGNFISNPKAGLLFPNFETGDVLQMTGDAEVILDSPEIEAFEGAERIWKFKPRKIVIRPEAMPLSWTFKEYSPNSLMTGSWSEAEARLNAKAYNMKWRPYRVSKIVDESTVIKSFWLEPADGDGIVRHEAGQHLPIRTNIPNENMPILRTYTLSVAPSDSAYRISVKRDGLASSFLHDKIKVGDIIEARAPQGHFTINSDSERPVVMLAAGVGITPFIAMLRYLAFEGLRTRKTKEAWLFQAARSLEERAFDAELNQLLEKSTGAFRLVRVLDETDEPRNPQKGLKTRISIDLLKAVIPFDDYDFYLCGPPGFMDVMYNGLRDLNISDDRIFFESFGPASVKRRPNNVSNLNLDLPAEDPVKVSFVKSGKNITWTPDKGSLLDLAEGLEIDAPYSCRLGSCGSCKTRLLKGKVTYKDPPAFPISENEALLCCAIPSDANKDGIVLDI